MLDHMQISPTKSCLRKPQLPSCVRGTNMTSLPLAGCGYGIGDIVLITRHPYKHFDDHIGVIVEACSTNNSYVNGDCIDHDQIHLYMLNVYEEELSGYMRSESNVTSYLQRLWIGNCIIDSTEGEVEIRRACGGLTMSLSSCLELVRPTTDMKDCFETYFSLPDRTIAFDANRSMWELLQNNLIINHSRRK